jgi:hypothetical protein
VLVFLWAMLVCYGVRRICNVIEAKEAANGNRSGRY